MYLNNVVNRDLRRDAREAEGAPLLREYVGKTCIEGSNPSFSTTNSDLVKFHSKLSRKAEVIVQNSVDSHDLDVNTSRPAEIAVRF